MKLTQLVPSPILAFIIRLIWSAMTRRILIGSFSGQEFSIRAAKMNCSRINFRKLLLLFITINKQLFVGQKSFHLHVWEEFQLNVQINISFVSSRPIDFACGSVHTRAVSRTRSILRFRCSGLPKLEFVTYL